MPRRVLGVFLVVVASAAALVVWKARNRDRPRELTRPGAAVPRSARRAKLNRARSNQAASASPHSMREGRFELSVARGGDAVRVEGAGVYRLGREKAVFRWRAPGRASSWPLFAGAFSGGGLTLRARISPAHAPEELGNARWNVDQRRLAWQLFSWPLDPLLASRREVQYLGAPEVYGPSAFAVPAWLDQPAITAKIARQEDDQLVLLRYARKRTASGGWTHWMSRLAVAPDGRVLRLDAAVRSLPEGPAWSLRVRRLGLPGTGRPLARELTPEQFREWPFEPMTDNLPGKKPIAYDAGRIRAWVDGLSGFLAGLIAANSVQARLQRDVRLLQLRQFLIDNPQELARILEQFDAIETQHQRVLLIILGGFPHDAAKSFLERLAADESRDTALRLGAIEGLGQGGTMLTPTPDTVRPYLYGEASTPDARPQTIEVLGRIVGETESVKVRQAAAQFVGGYLWSRKGEELTSGESAALRGLAAYYLDTQPGSREAGGALSALAAGLQSPEWLQPSRRLIARIEAILLDARRDSDLHANAASVFARIAPDATSRLIELVERKGIAPGLKVALLDQMRPEPRHHGRLLPLLRRLVRSSDQHVVGRSLYWAAELMRDGLPLLEEVARHGSSPSVRRRAMELKEGVERRLRDQERWESWKRRRRGRR